MLARGHYCPKDHQQHLELAAVQAEDRGRLHADRHDLDRQHHRDPRVPRRRRRQLDLPLRRRPQDPEGPRHPGVHRPHHDPMIPHTLVLKPGLVIHSVYNGYWFWGRPSIDDLWRDLRAVDERDPPRLGPEHAGAPRGLGRRRPLAVLRPRWRRRRIAHMNSPTRITPVARRERGGHRGLERRPLRPLRPVREVVVRRAWPPSATRRCNSIRRARATGCSTSAAALATRPSSSPASSVPGVARWASTFRAVRAAGRGEAREAGVDERRLPGGRRPGDGAARALRLRLLADGGDVLRQPGGGASQHPWGAGAGRPPLRGRLAAQARQRVGAIAPSRWSTATWRSRRRPTSPRAVRGRSRWQDADTVSDQLLIAGFESPTFTRCDLR